MRVLIADDDPGSSRALQAMLSRRGCEVVACHDGESAWRHLESADGPRVAVIDWNMPGVDGLEICRRLRASPLTDTRYIILLTVRDRPEDAVAALELADDYVRKPFKPDELQARVRAGFRVLGLQDRLARRMEQLEAITNAVTAFLKDGDWSRASGLLLRTALQQTGSEYGFAGVLVNGALRVLAHEGVRWDAVTNRELFENALRTYQEVGYLEFRDLDNLFGRAITTGEAVVANSPATDPRAGGRGPPGHPTLDSFLGVPIIDGKGVVGMIGVANRPGGYSGVEQDQVERLTATASVLYDSYRRSQAEVVLQARLRQSEKLQAVGRLAGGIAHDFNNVLTAVTGYSELVLDRLDERDPLRHEIREIRKAGDRAASLTRQLLAFSRKQVLQPKALDLNMIVTDMAPMLRRLIGEDVKFVTRLLDKLDPVLADPGQVEQVLMNLVVNARDAMPLGGTITIETTNTNMAEALLRNGQSGESGPCARLSVSDTGSGMDSETLAHLFEPFFTTKEVGRGTGLGLATVYGIVKQSAGQICVESHPGQGTRFDVYLPRTERRPENTPAQSFRRRRSRGASEKILLIEDDECVRALVQAVLAQEGYAVVETNGCEGALRFWKEGGSEVDLVLTDVVMPDMSGEALVRRLKAEKPNLRVLFMSGYTESGVVKHGVLVPETEFIQKPFTPVTLLQKIRAVLDAPCPKP